MSFKKLEVIVSTTIISIGSLLLSQTPTLEFMGQIVFSNPTGPQMCGLEAFAYMEQVFDGFETLVYFHTPYPFIGFMIKC